MNYQGQRRGRRKYKEENIPPIFMNMYTLTKGFKDRLNSRRYCIRNFSEFTYVHAPYTCT